MLAQAGFETPASESVFIRSQTGDIAREARTVVARLRTLPQVEHVRRTQTSRDGHSTLIALDLRGDAANADAKVKPVLNAVAQLQRQAPGFTVAEYGEASVDLQGGEKINSDFSKAETLSLPITFVILLLAFGAFVAAGIPVLLAISAVLAAIGLDTTFEPHLAHHQRGGLGNPLDRDGRRRRLLALLRETRAGGTAARAR